MGRIFLVFIRRLRLPFLLLAGFGLVCVRVYMKLENLRWQDATFWILNPHAIDYHSVHDATKFFALFVFMGVFAFQVWIAGAGCCHHFQPAWNGGLESDGE